VGQAPPGSRDGYPTNLVNRFAGLDAHLPRAIRLRAKFEIRNPKFPIPNS